MIKNSVKKILFALGLLLFLFPIFQPAGFAQVLVKDETVNLYFFWGEGCPHCAEEELFLKNLERKYPNLKVYQYEVWNNAENRKLLMEMGEKFNIDISGVPFTVVGDVGGDGGEKYFIGWYDEETSGSAIEKAVKSNEEKFAAPMLKKIKLPVFGEVETKNLSLPLFTVVMGALDGFNPCAMWTLLFLISLLLGMENRKRMWILGSTFIAASAAVYFLFMAAWLNLLLFVGFVIWVRIIIGLIALAGGGYNLKEYFTNPEAVCKVTGTEKRQKVFEKLKNITHQRNFYLALGGIIILAFAVNLVELICSAGLPAVYTQILTISALPKWQYYLYLLLYIFIFMLDDLIVFFGAMITLQVTGLTTKYTRLSHLIGGILMIIIGLLLIFKHEWLMFG